MNGKFLSKTFVNPLLHTNKNKNRKDIFNSLDRSRERNQFSGKSPIDSADDSSSLVDVTGGKIRDRRHINIAQKNDSLFRDIFSSACTHNRSSSLSTIGYP